MKKKGLIISTAVMVVVLIAALTTGTFAWFSQSANATVESIEMTVTSSAKVLIGLGSGGTRANYYSGDVTFTNNAVDSPKAANSTTFGSWTGAAKNLGTTVNTGLQLDVAKAVGTSAAGATMDVSYTETNPYYVAEESIGGTLTGIEEARINATTSKAKTDVEGEGKTDIVDLEMGILPTGTDTYKTVGLITISVPETQATLGMIAALHVEIKANSKSYSGQLFSTENGQDLHWYTDTTSTRTFTFYFVISESTEKALGNGATDVKDFSIRFYIDGYNADCCNDATGTKATIDLQFDGLGKSDTIETAHAGAKAINGMGIVAA